VTLIVALLGAVIVLAVIGIAVWRRKPRRPVRVPGADWTDAAGREFAGLNESARCDLIFAVAALEDERSRELLEQALDDPSEPVALAAAHALVSHGHRANVERYLAANPGTRATNLAGMLALLGAQS
jgi:HEAT repeat protein